MSVYDKFNKLYEEKEQDNLVIFVGAGISQHYSVINDDKKFPSWNELSSLLKLDEKSILDNPLQVAQIYQDVYSKDALVQKVKEIFPTDYDSHKIHEIIYDISPAHILTTNYDSLLEKALQKKNQEEKYHIVDIDEAIPSSKKKHHMLVKAHGDLHRGNIVLSEKDYNEYENNFPLILSFIRYVFSKYRVLFIGFSLTDPNFTKILYWVKNILNENSVKHLVVLHDEISENEKVYFEKKSVEVITQKEIVRELLNINNDTSDDYLIESLKYIKQGSLSLNYHHLSDSLNIFKRNVQQKRWFKFLVPSILYGLFSNSSLKIDYETKAKYIDTFGAEKRNNPWVANLKSQYNTFQKLFSMFLIIRDELNQDSSIKFNKDFCDKYFNDYVELMLISNISSIGWIGDNWPHQRNFIDHFSSFYALPHNSEYLLTYSIQSDKDNCTIKYFDKSFSVESPYYSGLILSDDGYYTNYLLGNNKKAYVKLRKKSTHIDLPEKYLHYFRLHYIANRSIYRINGKLDFMVNNTYKDIYLNMTKSQRRIFRAIHDYDFVQDFLEYLMQLEKDYQDFQDSETRTSGGFETEDLYIASFYINYSRFLKFIHLNQLPVLHDERVKRTIAYANRLYFEYFLDKPEENKITIPNWILWGLALDKDKNIRTYIVKFHNQHYRDNIYLLVDKEYVKDLLITKSQITTSKALISFENIFLAIALSSKVSNNFHFILELFAMLIDKDMKNLELYGKSIFIAYLNFSNKNNFSSKTISLVSTILNIYISYKLNSDVEVINASNINEESFGDFLYNLSNFKATHDNKYENLLRQEELLQKLPVHYLHRLFRALYLMGYKRSDLLVFSKLIQKDFQKDDFYNISGPEKIAYINDIENSVIVIYQYWNIDVGMAKLEERYLNKLKQGLESEGVSSVLSDAFNMFVFLIDHEIEVKSVEVIKKDLLKGLKEKLNEICKRPDDVFSLRKQVFYAFNRFLIRINQVNIIKECMTENNNFVYDQVIINKLVSDYNNLKKYPTELLEILAICNKSDNSHITQAMYWVINGNQDKAMDVVELNSILKTIGNSING